MHRARLASLLVAFALLTAGCVNVTNDALPQGNDSGQNDTQGDDQDAQNQDDDATGSSNDSDPSADPDPGSNESSTQQNHPPWPAPNDASIRPGVQTVSEGRQCTSNFLYQTPDNRSLFLGIAAHCVSEAPSQTNTNGCNSDIEPLEPGADVTIRGASNPGTLVYNSWHTMQATNESRDAVCQSNDFALVKIAAEDRSTTHPAVLHYGGPTQLANGTTPGEKLIWYGNSGTRPATDPAHRNEGYVLSSSGWTTTMYSVAPAVPGDSGSGVMLANGEALGVATTLTLAPTPGASGVLNLDNALRYANEQGEIRAELVTWPQFTSGNLP